MTFQQITRKYDYKRKKFQMEIERLQRTAGYMS